MGLDLKMGKKGIGEHISAEEWNALIDEVRRLGRFDCEPGPGGEFDNGPAGIKLLIGGRIEEWFPAVLWEEGPSAEADPSDNTYWFKRVRVDNNVDPVTVSSWGSDSDDVRFLWALATNLSEDPGATHNLTASDHIPVYIVKVWDTDGNVRYVFFGGSGGGGVFPVKITKTGGSNGTKTTTASWVYTVTTLAGTTIGTSVVLTRPRPKGTATFQVSDSYGEAFYDGAALVLWDAGEIYGTGTC